MELIELLKYIYIVDNIIRKLNNISFKSMFLLLIFLIINFALKNNNNNERFTINNIDFYENNRIIHFNKYYDINNYLNNSEYFKINFVNYSFSFKFKIIKVEYSFGIYDKNNNLLLPSNFALFKNIHLVCTFVLKNNISINSLAKIYKDKYYKCIEFFIINEQLKFGIIIYQINKLIQHSTIYFFTEKIFTLNNLMNLFNDIFDPMIININYNSLIKRINERNINKQLYLKKSYMQYPNSNLKRRTIFIKNKWDFKNIYNNYYCYCKGEKCLNENITEFCKYYFYLYIIDINKNVYPKKNYLFIDFIFSELSSDDVYPIFQKMIKLGLPAHYITEKKDIYNKYCYNITKCFTILPVKKAKNPLNSNFLEKYLILFLKIKVVISGRGTTFNTNIFYNIDYITYICVGHGVCYFKYFLYNENRIYGIKKNNKILLPPSEKIINIAKNYGWKDEDIISLNLPRWDKYNSNEIGILSPNETIINNNSIFIMFTWRDLQKQKSISDFYSKNIIDLLNNEKLNDIIITKNISIYISFHRLIPEKYIKKIKKILFYRKYIQFINQNDISKCLTHSSLVISDFSSIIFDFIYRRKPIILFIPDANDPIIKEKYKIDYYELIELMKNGTIYFENRFIYINDTIKTVFIQYMDE